MGNKNKMRSSNEMNIYSNDVNTDNIDNYLERLEKYTTCFVNEFESQLYEFTEEGLEERKVKDYNQSETSSALLETGVDYVVKRVIGIPTVIAAIVTNFIIDGIKFIYNKITDNHGKAKRLNAVFKEQNKYVLRRLFVDAACDIFFCFQHQFIKVKYNKFYDIEMKKLAIDAVNRVINYFCEEEKKIKKAFVGRLTRDVITEGVIHGKSTNTSILRFFKYDFGGFTIENEGDPWNSSDLYKNIGIVGIIKNDNNFCKYYKREGNEKMIQKYGYRFNFKWDSFVLDKYSECLDDYEIIITEDQLKEHAEKLLYMINKNVIRVNKEKSIWFEMKDSVSSFTGRFDKLNKLHIALQLELEDDHEVLSHVVAIVGLGGIGKSELARKYSHDYKHYYDNNVIWINAETKTRLIESLYDLYSLLNNTATTFDNIKHHEKEKESQFKSLIADEHNYEKTENEKEIKFLVKDIYKFLGNRKCLLILDKAESYEDLKEFLPFHLSPDIKKPHILITSQTISEDDNVKVIKLEKFTAKEGMAFMIKNLCTHTSEKCAIEAKMKELLIVLDYLPLAVSHATAYIKENKNVLKEQEEAINFAINNFLNEYKKSDKCQFLDFKENENIEAVYTTLDVTLNKIGKNPDALEIIQIMAYFSPDSININYFFSYLMAGDENRLRKAVKMLYKYSMIDLNGGIADIHRFIQKVIRLQLNEEDKKIDERQLKLEEEDTETMKFKNNNPVKVVEILRKALILLRVALYKVNENNVDDGHVTSVWNYASDYDDLNNEFLTDTYYKTKFTPLHLLAKSGNSKAIEKIIKYSTKFIKVVNIRNKIKETPFNTAAKNGHLNVVKILKEFGTKSEMSKSSLIAAFRGHIEIVKHLNLNDNDTNLCLLHAELYSTVRNGNSDEFKIFISSLTEEQLKNIIEPTFKGVDKNYVREQWTPLHVAAHFGYYEIVEFLILKGGDVNYRTLNGYTPLYNAAAHGHLKIVELLINNNAVEDAENKKGRTALHAAAKYGNLEIVKYLLEETKININFPDKKGLTPLHTACFFGKLNIVEILLNKEAEVNATDSYGSTPIVCAMFNCHTKIVELLLQQKDIQIYSKIKAHTNSVYMNFTLFHLAIAYDELNIVEKLNEKEGSSIINYKFYCKQNSYFTPMGVASYYNSLKVIEYLKENGGRTDGTFNCFNDEYNQKNRKPFLSTDYPFSSVPHGIHTLYEIEKNIYFVHNNIEIIDVFKSNKSDSNKT